MRKLALMSAVAAVAMVSAVEAATMTVNIDQGGVITKDWGGTENYPAVGYNGAYGGIDMNGAYSFLLPTIAAGEQIEGIAFRSGNSDSYWGSSTLQNIPGDVYGLRISTSSVSSLSASDYGSGTNQPGTKLSTDWFTGTPGPMADVDITSWVNATGYVAGNYLLLRTGTTTDEATITSLGVRWWTTASNAQLIITTSAVPEPAALGLLGLSTLALGARRRRS